MEVDGMLHGAVTSPDDAVQRDGRQDEAGASDQHDTSPKAFFRWLQSLRADLLAGQSERLPDLLEALSQKHFAVLLTSEQALLRGALVLHTLISSSGDAANVPPVSDVRALANVLAIHRAHTFDSGSSALDGRAYMAYASLLVCLHYTYIGIQPYEDDLTIRNDAERQRMDLVQAWTGVDGAPTFYRDGTYATLGNLRAPARQQVTAAGDVAGWDELLSVESVREALRDANSRLSGDTHQSQGLWALYYQFEVTHSSSEASTQDTERIRAIFLARLRTPHVQVDATAQAFSSFITRTLPSNEYEGVMASAHALVSEAKAVLNACEAYEAATMSALKAGPIGTTAKWPAWKPYTTWATSSVRAAGHQRSTRSPLDVDAVCAIFERALRDCGLPPSCIEETLTPGEPPLTRDEVAAARGSEHRAQRQERVKHEVELIRTERDASANLWTSYLGFLSSAKASAALVADVCSRARKALPSNGALLGTILRAYARLRRSEGQINDFLSASLDDPDLQKDGSAMTDLFLARVDVERDLAANKLLLERQCSSLQEALNSLFTRSNVFMDVFGIISFAFDTLASKQLFDESLRLEQLVSDWCLQGGQGTAALAETYWSMAMKRQPHNGTMWLRASRYYAARSMYDEAKDLLNQGLARRDIPCSKKVELVEEIVHLHRLTGSVQDVDWALTRLAKERERSWNEYYAAFHSAQPSSSTVHSALDSTADVHMEDDAETGAKRKASVDAGNRPEISSPQEKKGKVGDNKVTRDRENSSVMVDNLPPDATEADILTLFKDCGAILEIIGPRLISHPTGGEQRGASALVEFTSREAIPAVRSRNLKPIRSYQVEIRLGYECTLYVTNFPQAYEDDAAIRTLFGPYGRIFDVRWPSKKFAAHRRFCYVVYCSSSEAQAAQQQLHDTEMEAKESADGRIRMQVFLSDPNRRKVRSDAFNDDRELFINGLPRGVTEGELKEIFDPGVQRVRIPKHPDGRNRGIAYVDMDTTLDAQRVLGKAAEIDGGGYRLKGKLLTVNMVDRKKLQGADASAQPGGQEARLDLEQRSKCLYVRGLPSSAQEAVIQQILEHQLGHGSVKQVDWTPGEASRGQALVEFADAATAGRASLAVTGLAYDAEHPLQLRPLESRGAAARLSASMTEMGPSPPAVSNGLGATSTADGATSAEHPFIPRQAASARRGARGRGGLGFQRHTRGATNAPMDIDGNGVDRPAETANGRPKDQDAFRQMLQPGKPQ